MNKLRAVMFATVVGASSLTAGGGLVACGGSWWSNFTNDPVQVVQVFEQGVQIALNDAQVAWTFVQPYLPAANAAQINQQFQNAIAAVNHALKVLNDAVTAAVAAQQPHPDFSVLMTAITDAVGQVIAIIAQYTTAPAVDAGAPAPAVDAAAPAADAGAPVAVSSAMGKAPPSQAFLDAQAVLADLKKQAQKH